MRVFFVVFSIFLIARVLLGARGKRKAGGPVDVRVVNTGCLFYPGFCALGIFQLFSHH